MRGIASGRRELSALDGPHASRRQRTPHHSAGALQAFDYRSDRRPGLCLRCSRLPRSQGEPAHWADGYDAHTGKHTVGGWGPVPRVRFAGNLVLAITVLGLVISGKIEPAIAFMLGTTLALL